MSVLGGGKLAPAPALAVVLTVMVDAIRTRLSASGPGQARDR